VEGDAAAAAAGRLGGEMAIVRRSVEETPRQIRAGNWPDDSRWLLYQDTCFFVPVFSDRPIVTASELCGSPGATLRLRVQRIASYFLQKAFIAAQLLRMTELVRLMFRIASRSAVWPVALLVAQNTISSRGFHVDLRIEPIAFAW
jgi:hypothetical protein